jgi:hypothetical protein
MLADGNLAEFGVKTRLSHVKDVLPPLPARCRCKQMTRLGWIKYFCIPILGN